MSANVAKIAKVTRILLASQELASQISQKSQEELNYRDSRLRIYTSSFVALLSKIKLLSLVLLFSKNVLSNTAKLGATERTTLSNPQLINRPARNQNFSYYTHDKHTNA